MPEPASGAPASTERASSTTFYFAVALAICWLALLPASLAALGILPGPPEAYMAGAPFAVFSPTIAAVLAARREGPGTVRELFRGLGAWRFGPIWLVLAITLPGLLYAIARAIWGLVPDTGDLDWIFLPQRPEAIAGLFVVPIAEEIGWRGFALPRLIARHGARRGTAILSVLWALWHVPMFLAVNHDLVAFSLSFAFIVIGNVAFTWIYRRGGGSLLLAVLLHFGAHLDSPTHAIAAGATPLALQVAAFAMFAVLVLALDRTAWEGTRPEAPGTPPARR
jgi:membrane protease YdiL (CAAX protease family)